jgi:SPOR domain
MEAMNFDNSLNMHKQNLAVNLSTKSNRDTYYLLTTSIIKATRKQVLLTGLILLFLVSCVAQKQNDKTYYEDLSTIRPRVVPPVDSVRDSSLVATKEINAVPFTKTVNAKVDAVLDSIDRFNLMRRSVDGFTIQIYSGQNREEAMNTKKKMAAEIPDLVANLQYQQPKFRVTVGKYYSKLEAYEDLSRLRKSFTAAILVPEKIPIR